MLSNYHRFFFIGIKGVAFTPLALILKNMGKEVSGADTSEVFTTDETLKAAGIPVTDFSLKNFFLFNPDCVVYSAAHGGSENPLVIEAKARGIMVIHQAQLIAEILNLHANRIVVTGCHGKTTTTALTAWSLKKLGKEPTYIIGASSFAGLPSGEYKNPEWCVVEGDEYGLNPPTDTTPKVTLYEPNGLIITNVDYDHPDVYKDLNAVKDMYAAVITNAIKNKRSVLVVNGDDYHTATVIQRFSGITPITVGESEKNTFQITDYTVEPTGIAFVLKRERNAYPCRLGVLGKHNAYNAAQVAALLSAFGLPLEEVLRSFEHFTGAKRRMEIKGQKHGALWYDDYAHHPKEIATTLTALKEAYPTHEILVVFQPHTVSRTKALEEEFIRVLAPYRTYLTDIFASAREEADPYYTSLVLQNKAQEKGITTITYTGSLQQTARHIQTFLAASHERKLVVTLGAGDVYTLYSQF